MSYLVSWRSTKASILALAVMLAFIAVACGPSAQPTASATPAATNTASSSPAGGAPTTTAFYGQAATLEDFDKRFPFPPPPSKEPAKHGGTLVTSVSAWTNLDPRLGAATLHYNVYDSLFEQKLGWEWPDLQYKMEFIPILAESWDNPDPLTYIFRIRKGVKWQNLPPLNGRELNAGDVKYALESNRTGRQANKVGDMDKIEVTDPYTLKVTLKQPYGGFVGDKLAAPIQPWIFSKEADEAPGSLKDNVIGTGAFILKEIKAGESYTLEKNPNYWQKDYHPGKRSQQLPYFDKVKGIVFKDEATQVAAFRVGQVDALNLSSWEIVRDVLKTNPDIFAYRVPSATWGNQTIFMHLDRKPYDDIRVRRAISMAIDRQKMRETLYGGVGEGDVYGPIPWVWTWPQWPRDYSQLGPWYEYNPKKAKELLAEAGYPNGFKAKMQYYTSAYGSFAAMEEGALMAKEFLGAVGIDVTLIRMEAAAQNKIRSDGTWDDLLWDSITVGGPGYDDMVYWTYHSKASPALSYDRLNDPALDKMLDDQRKFTVGSPEHTKAAQEIFKYLADKMYRVTSVVITHYEIQQPWVQGAASAPYNWWIGYGIYAHKYVWFGAKAPSR